MISQPYTSQINEEKAPYDWNGPLPGEKVFWFNRFVLYRDLGAKRSLKAALAKEQEQIRLLGIEQQVPESTQSTNKQVPGSWKAASSQFHWQARAKAFDMAVITTLSERALKRLAQTSANKYVRLMTLNHAIEIYMKFQVEHARCMKPSEGIAYANLIRGLLKDVRDEMAGIDEAMLLEYINTYGLARYDALPPEKIAEVIEKCNLDEIDAKFFSMNIWRTKTFFPEQKKEENKHGS